MMGKCGVRVGRHRGAQLRYTEAEEEYGGRTRWEAPRQRSRGRREFCLGKTVMGASLLSDHQD